MPEPPIATVHQLLSFIATLSEHNTERPLDVYLRAFLGRIQQYRDTACSPAVAASLFAEALHSAPLSFEPRWLDFTVLPSSGSVLPDFNHLQHTLRFQLADLHRLEQGGLLASDPITLFGGIQSASKHRWYNFTVADYLEAASRGYFDHCQLFDRTHMRQPLAGSPEDKSDSFPELERIGRPLGTTECTWRDLADMLELGRLYE